MTRDGISTSPRRGGGAWIALAAFAITLVGGGALAFRDGPSASAAGSSITSERTGTPAPRRETRPTLDPARFVGKAAVTHQIARDMPAVLDQLYCYCQCDKSVGHKSLLSCYTDGHAAT